MKPNMKIFDSMKFDIKNILIFALAIGMTSCVETMKDGDMSTGYLGVPALDANIQVEEFGATKAAPEPPTLSVPDASTLHFKVTGAGNVVPWNQNGLWSSALQMPVGDYTIEVNYGSNTFGAPYYTGTCTGTISAVTEAVPAIGLRLCNSLLAVVLADKFTQHFTPAKGNCVTITSTSGSISTTLGNYVFVPAGETFTIQVAGKSSTNEDKTLSWTLAPLSAATATYVTCSLTTTDAPTIKLSGTPEAWGTVGYIKKATTANISDSNVAKMVYIAEASDNSSIKIEGTVKGNEVAFNNLTPGKNYSVYATLGALKSDVVNMTVATPEITISESAHHTMNESSELDGTDFKASINIPEKFKSITTVDLTLYSSDKAFRRSTSLSSGVTTWTSDGSKLTDASTWPFLPGGKYSLKGTATQNGSTVTLDELTITVPATPDFTVSVTGKTSYSVYCDASNPNRVSDANSMNAETISDIGTSVNIAENLRNNSNYGYGVQYLYDEKPATLTDNSITGCSWASHELKSKVTFANKEITSAITCHITGLPASYTTRTTYSNAGWKGNPSNNTTNTYSFYNNDNLTSPAYYLPNNTDIAVVITISPSYGTEGSFSCNDTSKNFNSDGGTFTYNLSMINPKTTITIKANISGSSARYCKLNSTNIKYR